MPQQAIDLTWGHKQLIGSVLWLHKRRRTLISNRATLSYRATLSLEKAIQTEAWAREAYERLLADTDIGLPIRGAGVLALFRADGGGEAVGLLCLYPSGATWSPTRRRNLDLCTAEAFGIVCTQCTRMRTLHPWG